MIQIDPTVLDDARRIYGLTSDQALATKLDLSLSTVSNLRAGRTSPSLGTLLALKRATGRPLDTLIRETGDSITAA